RTAVASARAGKGPALLVFDTYRWREHCGPNFDNDIGYRTEHEYAEWKQRCPIERIKGKLRSTRTLDDAQLARITAELQTEIDAAFEFAKAAPLPEPSQASLHVYA